MDLTVSFSSDTDLGGLHGHPRWRHGLEVQAGTGRGGQVPGYSAVTLGPGRWLAQSSPRSNTYTNCSPGRSRDSLTRW